MAEKKSEAKGSRTKTRYIYIVMIISLIILIFGAFGTIRTVVNKAAFDKYPVEYLETCDSSYSDRTRSEIKECEERNDEERRETLVNDLTGSISALLIGTALFVPHAMWAKSST